MTNGAKTKHFKSQKESKYVIILDSQIERFLMFSFEIENKEDYVNAETKSSANFHFQQKQNLFVSFTQDFDVYCDANFFFVIRNCQIKLHQKPFGYDSIILYHGIHGTNT
jgi:hypothetical protein